jgi:2-dehydropantoate 2-reductase
MTAGGGAPMPGGMVLVMGAGAVGCFVGGALAAAGADVLFVGRPRVLDALADQGLRLTDLDGRDLTLQPADLRLAEFVPPACVPALVLLCVKSGATDEAARELGARVPVGTVVLSLQNGVDNVEAARAAAPSLDVVPGMVPFNISAQGPAHFHRGTSGVLAARDHPVLQSWAGAFAAAGVPLALHADLGPVQWAKLLLNLNNPVNALSGLPLRRQLLDRDYRRVLAALQAEALAVLGAAGIVPARLTPLPPARVPTVLRLPNFLFERVAAKMLQIDERARSSMADDVAAGRPTEIDAICGAVVRLAASVGRDAPLNRRMVELIGELGATPRTMSGRELRAATGV